MKRTGIELLVFAIVTACIWHAGREQNERRILWEWVHPTPVLAGHPACDPNQPKRPPCDIKSCMQMGPDGKPNGHKCSSYCARGCCGCGTACTVDAPGEGPNPDEVLGRVD